MNFKIIIYLSLPGIFMGFLLYSAFQEFMNHFGGWLLFLFQQGLLLKKQKEKDSCMVL